MTTSAPTVERLRWSSTDDADRFAVENPATGAVITTLHGSGPDQVDAAVRAAHAAQPAWRARSPRERGRWLRRIADAIRDNADEIARLETSDNGKPFTQARGFDLEAAVAIFDLFAGLCEAMPGAVRDAGPTLDITTLEPYGVVAAIVPFNWPPLHTAGKLAPALAAGNAVVIKPPEQAPLSVLRMVEIVQQILPDDIVHAVLGGGPVGAALAGHPGIGKISFTGAPSTGSAVLRTAATNLTPTLMELGGKNPLLIFDDADLDSAIPWAIEAAFFNQGEACTAASRILVHVDRFDEVAERMAAAVRRLRVGDGADPGTHVGPLVTAAHKARVEEYLELGVREGATVLARAALPTDPRLARGHFVAPTLFTDVRPDMRIAREEIFGPVVAITPFDTEEEALELANGVKYGLAAYIWTNDLKRAHNFSQAVEAGMVWLNSNNVRDLRTPFGGVKASGLGHEGGYRSIDFYTDQQAVHITLGKVHNPTFGK
ncbi:aldehyde dehydrogenase family protein [Nocardia farcinica]|uniref:aldehyde dehydrogenase family protein n=1 Tax=Nocardia farcinica TaxID=37329 RepID=UPI002453EBC1|nr:aldehyde dehydrogenase family protein [Nocardia farcinica]